MDWSGPAAATTCLFQSPIVWHSVITAYAASQQAVSCVCATLCSQKKKGACASPLSLAVCVLPPIEPPTFPSLIFRNSQHRMGNVWLTWQHIFQNGINSWQHVRCQIVCGTMALLFLILGVLFRVGSTRTLRNTGFEWGRCENHRAHKHHVMLPSARHEFSSISKHFQAFISVKSATCTVTVSVSVSHSLFL